MGDTTPSLVTSSAVEGKVVPEVVKEVVKEVLKGVMVVEVEEVDISAPMMSNRCS